MGSGRTLQLENRRNSLAISNQRGGNRRFPNEKLFPPQSHQRRLHTHVPYVQCLKRSAPTRLFQPWLKAGTKPAAPSRAHHGAWRRGAARGSGCSAGRRLQSSLGGASSAGNAAKRGRNPNVYSPAFATAGFRARGSSGTVGGSPLYPLSSPQGSFHLSLSLPQYLHNVTADLCEAATPELSFQRLTNGSCWGSSERLFHRPF